MLSRTIRRNLATPFRRNAFAVRRVTTDAASSHADKEAVPKVGILLLDAVEYISFAGETTNAGLLGQ